MDIHHRRETLSAHDADLAHSAFTNVSLAAATFDDVNMQRSRITNVNLADATFVDVDLTNASFSNATLAGATIDGVPIDALLDAYRRPTRAGVVLYASDVARVRAFYEQVAELHVEETAADHVVLGSPAVQLVVVRIADHIASSIEIGTPPVPRTTTPLKLMLSVASIAAARAIAPALGGEVLPPAREWAFQGCMVCDGRDPEGNVVQLRQIRR